MTFSTSILKRYITAAVALFFLAALTVYVFGADSDKKTEGKPHDGKSSKFPAQVPPVEVAEVKTGDIGTYLNG
ncbi:MAG: hypothetical protein HQK92_15525, partial [Nitrospirae bacterium]|nr:hypothetical protein [Nitrospirota bacterium]